MKEKEAKLLLSGGALELYIEKKTNGKYYEIYYNKYNTKERFKKEISKSKYYRLNDEWRRGIILPRCKTTTINRLASLIRTKSDKSITEYDAKFVAEELIRLNYCKAKLVV